MKKIVLIILLFFCFGFTYKDAYIADLEDVRDYQLTIWDINSWKMKNISKHLIGNPNPSEEDRQSIIEALTLRINRYKLIPTETFQDELDYPFAAVLYLKIGGIYSINYFDNYRLVRSNFAGEYAEYIETSGYEKPDYDEIHFLPGDYFLIRRGNVGFLRNLQGEELEMR